MWLNEGDLLKHGLHYQIEVGTNWQSLQDIMKCIFINKMHLLYLVLIDPCYYLTTSIIQAGGGGGGGGGGSIP